MNKQQIVNLDQQIEIQKELTEITEKRADVEHIARERQKQLTDKALKLTEIGKPTSDWELQGLLGLAAFALGFIVGR